MKAADYRIESANPFLCRLLPDSSSTAFVLADGALAVAMAAKSVTIPAGEEIRVVHIPTGEVVFRKPGVDQALVKDDA